MGFNIENSVTTTVVFVQGLLSFFSPCILPLVPVYFGYLSGGGRKKNQLGEMEYSRGTAMLNTLFFVIGVSAAFFLLGFGFTALGKFFTDNQGIFSKVAGLIMIIFGLIQLDIFKRKSVMPSEKRLDFNVGKWTMGPLPAFLLGFTFSFAWTPCVGPVLASVLLLAGTSASALKAALLIGLYTAGFVIPFLLLSVFTASVMAFFKKHKNVVKYTVKVGGVLLIIMGILTFTGGLNRFGALINTNIQNEKQAEAPKESDQKDNSSDKTDTADKKESSDENKSEADDESQNPQAPDFRLKDQYGNEYSLSDFKGKTVFLNFWATWCPPCRREMPEIEKLYKEYGENKGDVIIIGVAGANYGEEGDEAHIKSFLKTNGYTFPVLIDEGGKNFREYGVRAFPTTFMIDKNGKVFGYVQGAMDKDTMKKIIEQTKSGKRS